jgi:antagonist of KipI
MRGARAAFAVRGGLQVEPIFGSRATSVVSHMGPMGGRPLRAGDVLPIGSDKGLPTVRPIAAGELVSDPAIATALPEGHATLRVMRGPQESMFTADAYQTLFRSRFQITTQSNRMGYRLDGPPLAHAGRADILSDATPAGAIQVPASGRPILLMADRQTTGGYPKIAVVIGADLPMAGQLAPGDWIEFKPCTREEAVDAKRALYRRLEGLPR